MSAKFTTTYACIDSMVAKLQADVNLSAVVSIHFPSKVLNYYIGYDEMKLPLLANAPYLVVMPGGFGRSSDQTMQTHSINMALVIDKETITTVNRVSKYTGIASAEIISKAIDDALKTWIYDNFKEGQEKARFQITIVVPAIKTTWSYDFQDQL